MERDDEVEKALRFREWTVLRFWGKDIMRDTEACVRVVEEAVEERRIRTWFNINEECGFSQYEMRELIKKPNRKSKLAGK